MFKDMAAIRSANAANNYCWFDRKTMQFFNTKLESAVYGGEYFITSERISDAVPAEYTIRRARADGQIDTVGEFQGFSTLCSARAEAKRLAQVVCDA